MTIYLERGPFLTIPDKLHPGKYRVIRNPEWQGELPEIVSFTDFLKWNYTVDYGNYIRELHQYGQLPLAYGISGNAEIESVAIKDGKYDRLDHDSFHMYVICDVLFSCDGYELRQKYIVHGVYRSGAKSYFLGDVELYNGARIRLGKPLDEFLVPILSKIDFETIAAEIIDKFYSCQTNYSRRINAVILAKNMGYDIIYDRLSKNGKVKSKLILDQRDTIVFDEQGRACKLYIDTPTILVDKNLVNAEKQNAIIHECVHAYLHNLFYELQSYYRKTVGRKMPEFDEYFYSKTQQECLKWMETQANAIPRFIQMPMEQTSDVILDFFEKLPGEPDWKNYRNLIDLVKWKFGVARNTAKKRIAELGWPEVRGVYVYNVAGYVEDYDVEYNFPDDCTYTLSLRHISEVYANSEVFVELIQSKRFIYLDGHVVLNNEKYVRREQGFALGLTDYARRNMAECCLNFKRTYEDPDYEYTFGELHKDDLAPIESREADDAQIRMVMAAFAETEEENVKLHKTPTVSPFGRAIQFHMERCSVTADDVADRSGLGVNTVSNMRSGKKVRLESVLAFCVALELEEAFRTDLMQKADVKFNPKLKAHRFYQTILKLCPDANVFQYNQMCEMANIKPWTKERQQTKRYNKGCAASNTSVAS